MADSDQYEVTHELQGDSAPSRDAPPAMQPERIGRYRIEKLLGEGGFGRVYLAHDEQLDRPVTVKIPHIGRILQPEDAEAYLAEARTVANLDHPTIVPVHDVGSTDEFPCYVVSKYIAGSDLSMTIKENRPGHSAAAQLVAKVAEALHYAHKQGLVHRDVNPGNILIGNDGQPYVVDFGLALREENIGKGPRYAGTPAYMSPEQARGEGHRVDGRSDIFSLGVVFYELLVGRRPFRGDTQAELLEQVTSYEARPLRQYDEKLPKELARICHKAMAKRAGDRYSSAHDLADDLRHFLAQQAVPAGGTKAGSATTVAPETEPVASDSTSVESASGSSSTSVATRSSLDSRPIKIVPKGLRCFDAHDADFFLELLPGPRDREGLPDSLRFWKTRIEEADPDNTFSVGLIYGPSGCGKSSFVRAGLLPRLSEDVISVYVEASPEETETRLLEGLRKRCTVLEDNLNLQQALAALRRGQGIPVGKKVLIVLDQFEQWLHAKKEEENTDLVRALRQCDGGRVQCIVMVRDDFWMAATRFMRELEVRLVEGHNSAAVDLFPMRHARKVLAAFGRAFGALPENQSDIDPDQKEFLKESVAGLAEEGKVICVRLALFAEMIKGKSWTPTTLKELGGTQGVGVTFLEETFSARTAPPEHRYHQQSARGVLKTLLPESGTDIKGQMKSHDQLLEASGYPRRGRDFDDLIRILDSEIRLITPTERVASGGGRVAGEERYYQLTHDYLVPPLREWLTRKQKETRRGRAELRLAERAALWNHKPESRHLPFWWENLNIHLFTAKKQWTESQRKMMGRAARVHALRTGVVVLALMAVTFAGVSLSNAIVERQARIRADGLVASLLSADIDQVRDIVAEMQDERERVDPLLQEELAKTANGSPEKLHLSLALLRVDESQIDYLKRQLSVCGLDQFPVVRRELFPHKDKITDHLWQLVQDEGQDDLERFQAAAAIAQYAPEDDRWNEIAPFVAQYLTGEVSFVNLGDWFGRFRSASARLTGPLTAIHADRVNPKQRVNAVLALVDYLGDEPTRLVDVIVVADEPADFSPLIAALPRESAAVRERLISHLQAPVPEGISDEQRDAHWSRQSLAAAALVHLGHPELVWPLLKFTPDPSLRSFIIHHLGKLNADPNVLAARLEAEDDVSTRRALIQSLGGLPPASITADRQRIAEHLRTLYTDDPDPGIHGSAWLTLRRWSEAVPELPLGEPPITEEWQRRIAEARAEIEEIEQAITAFEQEELPERQAAWELALSEGPTELPASLNHGLVAHYPLDETEGAETANAVAGGPGGAYEGPGHAEWLPGVVGNALRLDGQGGHINCGRVFNPERTDGFSYGCWFISETEGRTYLLAKIDSQTNDRGFDLWFQASGIGANLVHRGNNRLRVGSDRPASIGRWHHAMITYDGSSSGTGVRVYLDGLPVGTEVKADSLSNTIQSSVPLLIGMRTTSGSLQGRIDDLRIYSRRLSEGEVAQLHVSGLRALARAPASHRDSDQQAALAAAYRSRDETLQQLERQLATAEQALHDAYWKSVRHWDVNRQGQQMVIFPKPSADGSGRIDHSFAISSTEVTVDQFLGVRLQHEVNRIRFLSDECPVDVVTWFMAAEYCNRLSKEEGLLEEEWIYLPNDDGQYAGGMRIKENFLELSGYRMPLVAEWEHACRAGTSGSYCFGEPLSLLEHYGHYILNSRGYLHPVGSLLPNDAGLFDMHGNVSEWTHDPPSYQPFSPIEYGSRRWICGGNTLHHANFAISRRHPRPPRVDYEFADFGFRVARIVSP